VADVHDPASDDDRVMDTALDPGSESDMAGIVDDTFDDRIVDVHGTERTNLALPLSSFVGRAAEVVALGAELRAQRLLTITGSGGCGKTRLAYEVAWAELDGCSDGVWCVELAPVGDAERVAAELAQVLGVREEFGRPVIDTLAERLRRFDGLVVLDNCEHVLGGVRPLVDQLLRRCPTLHVLTTSREPLGVTGETTWRVPSLDRDAGVELFVQRAHSARPDFQPSDDELAAIARIVDRLDGIPLAVELAAARVRMMSPTGIESALEDRFRLLTGGSRTSLARQQTLEASVAWSYDLLEPDEQAVARRLAVMSDFTLDAAEVVAADDRNGAVSNCSPTWSTSRSCASTTPRRWRGTASSSRSASSSTVASSRPARSSGCAPVTSRTSWRWSNRSSPRSRSPTVHGCWRCSSWNTTTSKRRSISRTPPDGVRRRCASPRR
jgi:hypothetical protein